MAASEKPIRPVAHIHGGLHLAHYKNSAECETEILPCPETVTIPMQQHIGAVCKPLVKKGDRVYVGTLIGESEQLFSAPIHASISGTVQEIRPFLMTNGSYCDAVVIQSDGQMEPDPSLTPFPVETAEDLVEAAKASGLVGLGGAGFPAHIKLSPKTDVVIDTLIVNAAECEPYITADYRECIENTEDILNAVYLLKSVMGIKNVIIAVEDNKPKAFDALLAVAGDPQDTDNSVRVMRLKSQYPQGAEKVLIYSATGRKLPLGKLPADVGCMVMNVTSIAFLYRYVTTGMPLVAKRITVDGNCLSEPHNLLVPIGTSITDIVRYCGGYKQQPAKILYGGPMMGITVLHDDMPVLKYNNALLFFDDKAKEEPELACIRCGRCANVCPMRLMPMEIAGAYQLNDITALQNLGVMYCMECGSCAYACPSKRKVTQMMRLAKAKVRTHK